MKFNIHLMFVFLICALVTKTNYPKVQEKFFLLDNKNLSNDEIYKTMDSNGGVEQEWAAIYNGPSGLSDEATDIAVDSLGNVYVTGYSQGITGNYDCATIKYGRDGQMEWISRYDGGYDDYAYKLILDDSGNVFITGSSFSPISEEDYLTIKYSSAGVEQWVRKYNGPGNGYDRAIDIAVDNMGNVFVTGTSFDFNTERDFATIKFSPDGVEQWVKRYNGSENSVDEAVALALDNEGNVIVTGKSIGLNNRFNYATIKYASDGTEQWFRRFTVGGNRSDVPYALAVDGSGNVYITGSGASEDFISFAPDYLTIKYDSSGIQQWSARYNGPGNEVDEAFSVGVDDSGNVYITGISVGEGWWYDIATIKYNVDGVEQWVSRFNSGFVYDLAIDQSGNVYVTGISSDSTTIGDYTTIKYDTYGEQQWKVRYNGPGNGLDVALAIALDETGNVYLTGIVEVQGGIPTFDYATVKYQQKIIPVELINFTALINSDNIILSWQTATEINNSGFEIQKQVVSLPGSEPGWKTIAFIPGHGNTVEPKSYSFIDEAVTNGICNYRLMQINFDGSFEYLPDAAGIEVEYNIPLQFALEQNFPNPFNFTTIINYTMAEPSQVVLIIYNLLGEEVSVLIDDVKLAGRFSYIFNASSSEGVLSSGVYFYKLTAISKSGEYNSTKKFVLLK